MTKKSTIFRGGYGKGYKNFIADENLFVCTLIYFDKNIHFQWITIKCKNNKIKISLKYKIYYFMNWAIKIISKHKWQKFRTFHEGVTTKAFTVIELIKFITYNTHPF